MGTLCRIRLAAVADLGELAEIERAVFSDPWPATAFRDLLGPFAMVAAGSEGPLAGYVFARLALDEAEILNLAVRPEHRRAGIGRALLERVFGELVRVGAARVFLEVRASNEAGLAFYERLGFRAIGQRRGYYSRPREDALVLTRVIGPNSGRA